MLRLRFRPIYLVPLGLILAIAVWALARPAPLRFVKGPGRPISVQVDQLPIPAESMPIPALPNHSGCAHQVGFDGLPTRGLIDACQKAYGANNRSVISWVAEYADPTNAQAALSALSGPVACGRSMTWSGLSAECRYAIQDPPVGSIPGSRVVDYSPDGRVFLWRYENLVVWLSDDDRNTAVATAEAENAHLAEVANR